jgi:hypothetical protein
MFLEDLDPGRGILSQSKNMCRYIGRPGGDMEEVGMEEVQATHRDVER